MMLESARRSWQTSFVTNHKGWTLDKTRLREALARFHSTNPAPKTVKLVNEWLMDLVKDPLHRAKEDPDHPGIFFGRVVGTNVGVVFVPNPDEMKVYVSSISDQG